MPFTENHFFNTTRSTVLFACGAIIIGFVALIGWLFAIPELLSFNPNWRNMIASSVVVILTSTALLLRTRNKKKISRLLGYIVSFVGIISLTEYAFGWQSPIGELLFKDKYAYRNFLSSGISKIRPYNSTVTTDLMKNTYVDISYGGTTLVFQGILSLIRTAYDTGSI